MSLFYPLHHSQLSLFIAYLIKWWIEFLEYNRGVFLDGKLCYEKVEETGGLFDYWYVIIQPSSFFHKSQQQRYFQRHSSNILHSKFDFKSLLYWIFHGNLFIECLVIYCISCLISCGWIFVRFEGFLGSVSSLNNSDLNIIQFVYNIPSFFF